MSSDEFQEYNEQQPSGDSDLDDKALLEEYQKTTLRNVGAKSKKKDWVPDEQYRLLYVYFKDMSLEPLLKSKQEVEVSAKIKKSELIASNFKQMLEDVESSSISAVQKRKLVSLKGGKKTASGQYSTSEAVLEKVDHPITQIILDYRTLAKLKSTYTDRLVEQADATSKRVHTSYHQAVTTTGRLSSTDPNLQNIPIRGEIGRQIRKAFVAPKDRVILAADYSQIELRLMAHFCEDDALVNAFNEGRDIHQATASEVLNIPLDEVTSDQRRQAKAVNFGLLYGMSEFGLIRQLGFTREESQNYIKQYFQRYPGIYEYMQRTRQLAQEQGFVETLLGRRLYTPDIHARNMMVRKAAERAAINAPLQGSAADIIKLAMIAIEKKLDQSRALLLLQVHDELVFEVDEDYVSDATTLIKDTMQDVFTLNVPLVVEVGKGNNWDEAH